MVEGSRIGITIYLDINFVMPSTVETTALKKFSTPIVFDCAQDDIFAIKKGD